MVSLAAGLHLTSYSGLHSKHWGWGIKLQLKDLATPPVTGDTLCEPDFEKFWRASFDAWRR